MGHWKWKFDHGMTALHSKSGLNPPASHGKFRYV